MQSSPVNPCVCPSRLFLCSARGRLLPEVGGDFSERPSFTCHMSCLVSGVVSLESTTVQSPALREQDFSD